MIEVLDARDWGSGSRSVTLGALSESEKRLKLRAHINERPFDLVVGFASKEQVFHFLVGGDYGYTRKAAHVISQNEEIWGTEVRSLRFVRKDLRSMGIKSPIPYPDALAHCQKRTLAVSPDAAITLLARMDHREPADYVRVMMQPLITDGRTDVFELSANGPTLRTSPGQGIVSPEMEFFFQLPCRSFR